MGQQDTIQPYATTGNYKECATYICKSLAGVVWLDEDLGSKGSWNLGKPWQALILCPNMPLPCAELGMSPPSSNALTSSAQPQDVADVCNCLYKLVCRVRGDQEAREKQEELISKLRSHATVRDASAIVSYRIII